MFQRQVAEQLGGDKSIYNWETSGPLRAVSRLRSSMSAAKIYLGRFSAWRHARRAGWRSSRLLPRRQPTTHAREKPVGFLRLALQGLSILLERCNLHGSHAALRRRAIVLSLYWLKSCPALRRSTP